VTRVGILGLGTVGSAVARRLIDGRPAPPAGISLTHIFDRRSLQKRARFGASAANVSFTDCIDDVLRSAVDVVVEAIGGVDPAVGWIRAALLAGKSVVTVTVVSDIAAIARDRAAVVPAPVLSSTFSVAPSSFPVLTTSFSRLEAV